MSTGLNLALLRVCKYKEEYDKVRSHIFEPSLDEHTKVLLDSYNRYFNQYTEATCIDMDMFRHMFYNVWYKKLSQDVVNTYNALFDHICTDVTYEERVGLINSLVDERFATELANHIEDYESGEEFSIVHAVEQQVIQAKEQLEIANNQSYGTIESLRENKESACKYQWPLPCLAEKMRPLEGGDAIGIAALTDVGKTSLTLFFVTFFAHQTTKPWLWFNNEGTKERIQKRAYGMMLAATSNQIDAWIEDGSLSSRIEEKYGRPPEQVLRVFDSHGKSNVFIEEQIKQTYETDGVAGVTWDMLDNVRFVGQQLAAKHEVLEQLYQWARETGVKYDYPTLETSQQSANQEWQKWPGKEELKGSKVGKQGAMDVLMFMTQPVEAAKDTERFLSTPKNKLAIPTASAVQEALRWNKMYGIPYQEQIQTTSEPAQPSDVPVKLAEGIGDATRHLVMS